MGKVCSGCGEDKPLEQFNKRNGTPDGLQYRCKSCMIEAMRVSRANNPDYQNEYYATHRQQVLERRRVARAVKQGRIPHISTHECSVVYCNKQAEEYHHLSYEKRAYLAPVCRMCHRKIHDDAISVRSLAVRILFDGDDRWSVKLLGLTSRGVVPQETVGVHDGT